MAKNPGHMQNYKIAVYQVVIDVLNNAPNPIAAGSYVLVLENYNATIVLERSSGGAWGWDAIMKGRKQMLSGSAPTFVRALVDAAECAVDWHDHVTSEESCP